MPSRPPHPCNAPACSAVTRERYCPAHAAQHAQQERVRLARRPSAAARGYGSEWRQMRDEHLARYPMCVECGQTAFLVDHRIPKRFGGADSRENLQSMCSRCHQVKSRREQRVVTRV